MRLPRALVLALCAALASAPMPIASAAAQSRPPQLELVLPGANSSGAITEGPRVVASGMLADSRTRELLTSGFPTQLRFRLELWREGGWFDDLERAVSWDVIVAYDPAAPSYRIRRIQGSQFEDLGSFPTIDAAQAALDRPFATTLVPARAGRRYYYTLSLDVETLSVSDLDQLERWLRGELRPAVRGKSNPASALGNGVRTLVTRILGGERRHYEVKSAGFRT